MTHPLHEDPAVLSAILGLTGSTAGLRDNALVTYHGPTASRMKWTIAAAAQVRAGLDALDAAIAAAEAAEAGVAA
jgi:hypothetical protein